MSLLNPTDVAGSVYNVALFSAFNEAVLSLKFQCDQKIYSYFSLDFKTMLTKQKATKVLSLDFRKTPFYFNWNFPI